ncbi:hypothetical protein [Lewinella sp. IMCC34183]|uniref:hypothetical protein n=1 Tax=Lewinella sp. IMCC34183 TaxID=2248762 RepID=UPI000E23F145|nr:hypothetical protein [Lewinella sp. IMCC34183]
MEKRTTITTYPELRERAPEIVAAHGDDPRLATAALANPVLALEAAGYDLAPDLRETLEERLRFGEVNYKRLLDIRKQLRASGGGAVDPLDPVATHALIDRLSDRSHPYTPPTKSSRSLKIQADELHEAPGRDDLEDRLEEHPLVAEVLEYRRIYRTSPPFASRDDFQRLMEVDLTCNGTIRLQDVRFSYRQPGA